MQKFLLCLCCIMLVLMVWVGGFTRLTTSGLSITEWNPVYGVVPPLKDSSWVAEFEKYKKTQEYEHFNKGMSVKSFKRIYLTEYTHRLLARLTGFAILVTMVYCLANKTTSKNVRIRLTFATIMCLIQGFVGWYMVKSGLNSLPFVSHYRLALHLLMALIIFYLLWTSLLSGRRELYSPRVNRFITLLLSVLLFIQVGLGGLVAGLKAGLVFNTFPLMDNQLIPDGLFKTDEIFDDPLTVQFLHRALGLIIFLFSLIVGLTNFSKQHFASSMLIFLAFLQITLGIGTLLLHVDIAWASLHQVVAFLLFASAVDMHGRYSSSRKPTNRYI